MANLTIMNFYEFKRDKTRYTDCSILSFHTLHIFHKSSFLPCLPHHQWHSWHSGHLSTLEEVRDRDRNVHEQVATLLSILDNVQDIPSPEIFRFFQDSKRHCPIHTAKKQASLHTPFTT